MVSRGRHPKQPIAAALDRLDDGQFDVAEEHSGHRWGKVICRECGEWLAVWSTPRVPEDTARAITRFAIKHTPPHPRST